MIEASHTNTLNCILKIDLHLSNVDITLGNWCEFVKVCE